MSATACATTRCAYVCARSYGLSVVCGHASGHTRAIENRYSEDDIIEYREVGIPMAKQWQNDDGYTIQLTQGATRSMIEVKDAAGAVQMYHEFAYWQRAQAEREALTLVRLSGAYVAVPEDDRAGALVGSSSSRESGNISYLRGRTPKAAGTAA